MGRRGRAGRWQACARDGPDGGAGLRCCYAERASRMRREEGRRVGLTTATIWAKRRGRMVGWLGNEKGKDFSFYGL
jgi:hypothetical protein